MAFDNKLKMALENQKALEDQDFNEELEAYRLKKNSTEYSKVGGVRED